MARAEEGEGGEGQVRSVWKDHNLHVIFGVTLMGIMGTTSVTPAFPKIAQELGVSTGQVFLLITVYTILGILLTAIDGTLSDRYGRRKILVPSLMLFGLAGGACAFVQDFGLLLALRVLQGVGAAGLGALNNAIIGDIYMGRERTAALGYNSSVLSIGTASWMIVTGVDGGPVPARVGRR